MAEAFCLDEAPEGTWGPRKIALGENAKEVYGDTDQRTTDQLGIIRMVEAAAKRHKK